MIPGERQLKPTPSLPAGPATPTTSWLHLEEPPTLMEDLDPGSVQWLELQARLLQTPGTWEVWTHSLFWDLTTPR